MPAIRIVAACLLMGALSACTSADEIQQRFAYRWGPDPGLPPDKVLSAITGQVEVLDYITTNAFKTPYPEIPDHFTAKDYWFAVAEWGFNVGRRDCDIYMDYMFRLNREKQRDDLIITGLNTAAAAIVAATTKSQKPLSILAASFGLTTTLNDALFQSYLFSEAPGLVSTKVKQLQDAYQQQVELNQQQQKKQPVMVDAQVSQATGKPGQPPTVNATQDTTTTLVVPITTAASAFSAIQNYYHICLPQSIEGVLLQAVADSTAKPSSPSNASTPKLAQSAK